MSKHTPISDQENAEINKAIEINQYVDNSELNLNIANLRAQANKNPDFTRIDIHRFWRGI